MPRPLRPLLPLILCAIAPLALGQANPLEQDGTQPPTATQPLPANPVGAYGQQPAANQLPPIKVPAYFKPGSRLIYANVMTLEPKEPGKVIGTTNAVTLQQDIVKVLPDRLLVAVTNYSASFNNPAEFILSGGQGLVINANHIMTGQVAWREPADLKAMQSSENIEVNRGPWKENNQQYEATIITIRGEDSTEISAFDSKTGLLLTRIAGVGPFRKSGGKNNGLNRQTQTSTRFQTFRNVKLPWHNAPTPDWVKNTKSLEYQGGFRMTVSPDVVVPMTMTLELTEVGDDYAIGQTTLKRQGEMDQKLTYVAGPGSPTGYWINPQTLANIQPGEIDTDPHLGFTVRYQVQQGAMGKAGVITQTSKNGNQVVVHAYRLQDGALVYSSIQQREPGIFVEISLKDRTAK